MQNNHFNLNTILYGPPGTGKTYNSAHIAVAICDEKSIDSFDSHDAVMARFNELKINGRIAFTTFHQSYGYEEFIEGIRPVVNIANDNNNISYTIKSGVFKDFCNKARVKSDETVWLVKMNRHEDGKRKAECFRNKTMYFDINKMTESQADKAIADLHGMRKGDYILSYSNDCTYVDGIGKVRDIISKFDENGVAVPAVNWLLSCTNVKLNIEAEDLSDAVCFTKAYKISVGEIRTLLKSNGIVEDMIAPRPEPYVFVIDEINRGNISKIFGELITLIEDTKREGCSDAASATLPYSAETFSVPNNVYILGTMNTADRSIALLDTALRRRFCFIEMMPNTSVLDGISVEGINISKMLEVMNNRITSLYDREHTIGHAFFTSLRGEPTLNRLSSIFKKSIIPLLQEYFYEDYQKIQLVLGDNAKSETHQFIRNVQISTMALFAGNNIDIDIPDEKYEINEKAFNDTTSYTKIYE